MSEENRTDQRKTREMLRYDEICKHLLSYKPILARILKECVEEYHDLSYEVIQACIEPDRKGAHMHIIGRNTEDLTIPEAKISMTCCSRRHCQSRRNRWRCSSTSRHRTGTIHRIRC